MAHTFEASAGEHIDSATARLSAFCAEHGEAVMMFNDIAVWAKPGDTAKDLSARWNAIKDQRKQAYLNSPQKKIDDERREAEVARLQETHDNLMRDLVSLDWSSDVAVLDWLCAMQRPSDRIGVIKRHSDILAAFEANGFRPDVNIGNDFDAENRDNYFRYIVGQALSTMKHCAIHGMVHELTNRWKVKFQVGTKSGS